MKWLLTVIIVCVCIAMNACAFKKHDQKDRLVLDVSTLSLEAESKTERITALISASMKEAAADSNKTVKKEAMQTIRNIINGLGEHGYVAVDGENQINLTNAAQVIQFCDAVRAKQTASLTIIQVIGTQTQITQEHLLQGFQLYEFYTKDGSVEIDRCFYQYNPLNPDNEFTVKDTVKYHADLWQYTQDGYLLFAGSYFAEDYYIISLTDAPEYAAIRVAPLDERCRELNRRYIQPVGYACNNLFLVNWNETDFASLDLYDVFDRFYPMVYDAPSPYVSGENPNEGLVYQIPDKEFETAVQAFLNINIQALRSQTAYMPSTKMYAYRPRGLYEIECTSQPVPEVTGYTENADGTLTMTVNAVFPYEHTARAFAHEVTIRLLENGAFQYVSNRMLDETYESWWRTERLTESEWEAIYGEQHPKARSDETLWYLPHAEDCLLTEAEQNELQNTILTAAELLSQQYQNKEFVQGTSYASNIGNFSAEDCRETVRLLGKAGYVSMADGISMENFEEVEAFYQAYTQMQDAAVTIFEVHSDGLLGVRTFIHRAGNLQTYYVGVDWREGGMPYIKNTLVSDIAKITYTPKGYLIYTYKEDIIHSDANQYLRVKPLSDACRALTEKYVAGIRFADYDAFVTSWDSSTVEDILVPCLFEDFYRIHTGASFRTESDWIPAEEYERIMMLYLPVTKEQLRRKCGYDADRDSYPYEMIFAAPYAPFGEVVDFTENADGTITLTVDGVCIDKEMDCAFTNELVVQPFADGTFRYLSNQCLTTI